MSVFGDSIGFLVKLGVYDIILPFLLVFTIVFALLDKTKILGTEVISVDGKDKEVTKKNLNAMIAFVTGFFVVASAQLVAVINQTLSQMFIILLLIICFLMLAGALHEQTKEGFSLKNYKVYNGIFMFISFVAIIMIVLNALGWLTIVYDFLRNNWNSSYVASVILILFIIGFMYWIMKDPTPAGAEKKS